MKLVPEQRLLWLAAFPVILFLPGPQVAVAPIILAGAILLALLDALPAVLRRHEWRVASPPVLRFSRQREHPLELGLSTLQKGKRPLRLKLAIHPTRPLTVMPAVQDLALHPIGPEGELAGRLQIILGCEARGVWKLGEVETSVKSPLGLWRIRQRTPIETEVRVYPDLRADRRRLSPLLVRQHSAGAHLRRFLGKGREFEKLRDYLPGDSLDSIHWKASAKRRELVTKEYQVERTQQVYVVLDASRLSALRPSANEDMIFERYLAAALTFGGVLQSAGDCFGLFCFSDRRELALPARAGPGHLAACQEALLRVTPRQAAPDFGEAFAHIAASVRRRSLFIFLTDLSDPVAADAFLEHAQMLTSRHVILVVLLVREDVQPLFTKEPVASDEQLYSRLAAHMEWRRARELGARLKRAGVDVAYSSSSELAVDIVNHYISIKQRQRL